ncbi:arylsulfatase [Anaerosinus massiliensis]|uniref:arylsulfatase n=1 Tax=Massilibacillus massiliensis TaxID=1806837 RepID=UPI000A47841A|nr:arylsulfatase [Massilibacillus massiliensis]
MMDKRTQKALLRLSVLGVSAAHLLSVAAPVAAAAIPVRDDLSQLPAVQSNKMQKTNIIYIVLDDMGFSDFGSYGSEIQTPNIDQLAANGLRYNNSEVCPICSPSRAALLTGRDSHTVGMGNLADLDFGINTPDSRGRITDKAATVAQILKLNGFSTMAVGKWHVAPMHQLTPAGPFDYWPLGKGFERYYGFLEGEADQYDPPLVEDNHIIETPKTKGYHFSEDVVNKAEKYIADQVSVSPDKPFFLYLAFGAPHSPHQVPKEYIDRYNGVYDQGWDKIRQARFEKQKALGIIPADAELSVRDPEVKLWNSLSADEKKVVTRFEETYAGFLTHADEQIGKLVSYLKQVGQYDNTMIVLLSDNGATCYGGDEGAAYFPAIRGEVRDGTSKIPAYLKELQEMGGPDFQGLYPRGWSMVSNTPFKAYKGSAYNGGTRTPLIIQWPEGIKRRGEISTARVDVSDLTPTVLDVLHLKAPEVYQGIKQLPMTGVSIANTFSYGKPAEAHPPIVKLLQGNRSIIQDGWKAVASYTDGWSTQKRKGRPFEEDRWELYNLNQDYTEAHDLAAQYPEKLAQLKALWQTEAKKRGMILQRKPGPTDALNNRSSFKYYAGMERIGQSAGPKILKASSYTITVPVTRDTKKAEGVLVAQGDAFSGYTLYVKNNRLVYEQNYFGEVTKLESNQVVPTGATTLKYQFVRTGKTQGVASIFIDDHLVGEVELSKTFGGNISAEGLSIGEDSNSPVSKNYADHRGFHFTGDLKYVLFELQHEGSQKKSK